LRSDSGNAGQAVPGRRVGQATAVHDSSPIVSKPKGWPPVAVGSTLVCPTYLASVVVLTDIDDQRYLPTRHELKRAGRAFPCLIACK
jgi:hypothetical protein